MMNEKKVWEGEAVVGVVSFFFFFSFPTCFPFIFFLLPFFFASGRGWRQVSSVTFLDGACMGETEGEDWRDVGLETEWLIP